MNAMTKTATEHRARIAALKAETEALKARAANLRAMRKRVEKFTAEFVAAAPAVH